MRKVYQLVAVFIALLFAGDRLAAWGLHRLVALSQDRYVAVYEGRAKADILVLGNSRADNHFPPRLMARELGVPTANLGLGGISTVLSEVLLKDFVERNRAPRLVVLEVTNLIVDPDEVGDLMLFATYSERIEVLLKRKMPDFFYAAKAFNLLHYNSEMLWRVTYGIWKPPADRVHRGSVTPAFLRQLQTREPSKLESYPENEAALRRMLAYAEENRIRVQLVIAPYLKEGFAKITNFESWKAGVEQVAGGRKIWDYSQRFGDTALFRDSLHMNSDGTARLLRVMVDDGFYEELRTGSSVLPARMAGPTAPQ